MAAAFFAVRNRKAPIDDKTTENLPIILPEIQDTVFDYDLGMLMLNG